MTTELMADFSITASDLGQLSAVFFYTYVLMQIPTGVLVDSWGAKRLLVVGSVCRGAGGTFIFGIAPTFGIAALGRAVLGAGTAVGWVVILKLASHWFPSHRFAMLTGLGLLIGNIGALVAQVPLRLLVEQFHWRPVALGSAVAVLGDRRPGVGLRPERPGGSAATRATPRRSSRRTTNCRCGSC